jgi:hypothetical protein
MPLVISGATSGQTTIQATDAVTATITLPSTSGTVVVNNGAQTIEFADGSASAPSITNSGDTNTGIFFPAADTIAFTEGGTEAMRIDSSGNLGLGVTPSGWASTIKAFQFATTGSLEGRTNSGSIALASNIYIDTSGDIRYITTNFASRYQQNAGQHIFYNAPSGTAGNVATFTTAMTLDSSGNLGLGVTPSAWRTIQKAIDIGTFGGNISTINAGGGGVFLSSNGYVNSANDWKRTIAAGSALYLADGTGHYWFNGASGAAGGTITFTQAMTLDASGRLGLGISSPTAKLHIKQGADGFGDSIRLERSGAANYWDMVTGGDNSLYVGYNGTGKVTITSAGDVLVGTTNTDPITAQVNGISLGSDYIIRTCVNSNPAAAFSRRGTDGSILVFHKNVNGVGSISVTTSATAYNTSSDYRLKDNIAPMVGALDTVAKLKPVTYNWKADGSDGQGFIAHELAEVVPDCVNGEKDATKEEEYEISPAIPAVLDEEGNEVTPAVEAVMETRTVPVYQGIDTSFLVATLTAAIQEQQAMIDELKAKVAALEAA